MSFPPGTEMFQFPGFASFDLWIQSKDTAEAVGCPIRKSTDQRLLAAPRGLSQRAASFIASQCQGIHQMPFIALDLKPLKLSRTETKSRELESLSFNVSAFVRKLTMGIFAAAFDARESAHLRPRITKRPSPRSATLPIHNVKHRAETKTVWHCCRQVIASETLTSTPNPLPARSRLLSLAYRGRPPSPVTVMVELTGSNRRPPACKAGALPTELQPQDQPSARGANTRSRLLKWWAREDLNFRPHAYQARALTN